MLSGAAIDREDGSLPVRWESDRDGWLGTGSPIEVGFQVGPLSYGKHRITASATDSSGLTGKASIEIEITNDLPAITILEPANGVEFGAGEPIVLRAQSQDLNEKGNVLPDQSVRWSSSLAGELAIGHSTSVTFGLGAGTHVLTVTGTDGAGAIATASVTIVVRELNDVPPQVRIDSPSQDMRVAAMGFDSRAGRPYADVRISGWAYEDYSDCGVIISPSCKRQLVDVPAHWYGAVNGAPFSSTGSTEWVPDERECTLFGRCWTIPGTGYTRHYIDLRLYTNQCNPIQHSITLSGTDAAGNTRTSTRLITVDWCIN
jgi:hypothetical protein